jgi:hypothetical protein
MSILGLLSLAFAPGLAIVLYVYLKDIELTKKQNDLRQ